MRNTMIVNSIFVVIVVVIIITTIKQLVEFKAVVYYIPNHFANQPKVTLQIKTRFDWITQN